MVKKEQEPVELDPEVERRLAAIRARDLEKLTEEQMNRYFFSQFKHTLEVPEYNAKVYPHRWNVSFMLSLHYKIFTVV